MIQHFRIGDLCELHWYGVSLAVLVGRLPNQVLFNLRIYDADPPCPQLLDVAESQLDRVEVIP